MGKPFTLVPYNFVMKLPEGTARDFQGSKSKVRL